MESLNSTLLTTVIALLKMNRALFLLATICLLLSVASGSPSVFEDNKEKADSQSPEGLAELESLLSEAENEHAVKKKEAVADKSVLENTDERSQEELAELESYLKGVLLGSHQDQDGEQALNSLVQDLPEQQDERNDKDMQALAKAQGSYYNMFTNNIRRYYSHYTNNVRSNYNSYLNAMKHINRQNRTKTRRYFQKVIKKLESYVPRYKNSPSEAKKWLQGIINGVKGLLGKLV